MNEQSDYKRVGRWRASLIYITNQLITYTAYVLLQFFCRYPTVLNCVDSFKIIGGTSLAIIVGTAFVLNPPSLVLCMPRKMTFLAHFVIPCTISIFKAVLIVMIALGVSEPARAPPTWDCEIVFWGNPTFAQGFTSVPNIAFAYAGSQAFVTVMAEMRDPSKDIMLSMYILQIFAIPMYSIVGAVICGLTGQYVDSPALGTAPPVPAKVAYGILLPTLVGTSLVFGHTSIKYIFAEVISVLKIKHKYDKNTKRTWIIWISIGTVFWVLAFNLANAIPLFEFILSISSAIFVSWFTSTIVLLTLFMNCAGLWVYIDQLIAAFNDPASPVNGPLTCADNSVRR
ncbi:hypothetical protein BU25DRAFT_434602 [Macroventuria anomochaeta]|uniref:Uncharacterized protein n=1 Tax=Macroventuria anomochaeta TaxID=301207 RepID=A0ACB6RLM7_9PLEO|nr:uncharacterized protein BU25DRAFT_434602 [Macroventuria anomochaeta]KAF2622684.1 hypothetical protein BU25DRAFT_434602 [Macroventuria anomochaeta]